MHKIVSGAKVIGICDNIRYVKKKPNTGAWIQTVEEDSEAISVNGTLYTLKKHTPIEGVAQASVSKIDSGEYIFDTYTNKLDYESKVAELENALCDIDKGE